MYNLRAFHNTNVVSFLGKKSKKRSKREMVKALAKSTMIWSCKLNEMRFSASLSLGEITRFHVETMDIFSHVWQVTGDFLMQWVNLKQAIGKALLNRTCLCPHGTTYGGNRWCGLERTIHLSLLKFIFSEPHH